MKHLLLVRHAATGRQYAGRYIGSTDLPIEVDAAADISGLVGRVNEHQPERMFSSPLRRALQTARFFEDCGVQVEIEESLREIDFGAWEGMNYQEIEVQYPDLARKWSEDFTSFGFPGGENFADFMKRVEHAVQRFLALPQQTILIVSHGGVMRAIICCLLGMADSGFFRFEILPASLTLLSVQAGTATLQGLNLT